MKIKLYALFAFLFILFIVPLVATFSIREISFDKNIDIIRLEKLSGEKVFVQNFISDGGPISSIGINFRNFNQINKKDLYFKISDQKGNVREIFTNGVVIKDGSLMRFKFTPILSSKGDIYTVSISSQDSTDVESLEVGFGEGDVFVNKVFYRPENKYFLMKTVWNDFMERYFSDAWFFRIYTLIIISLFVYIFWPMKLQK